MIAPPTAPLTATHAQMLAPMSCDAPHPVCRVGARPPPFPPHPPDPRTPTHPPPASHTAGYAGVHEQGVGSTDLSTTVGAQQRRGVTAKGDTSLPTALPKVCFPRCAPLGAGLPQHPSPLHTHPLVPRLCLCHRALPL